jgi:hypothetical protein
VDRVTTRILARFVSIVSVSLICAGSAHAQSGSRPTLANAAAQAPAAEDDDAALVLAEPDFRVVTLPTTLRLPLHKGNFQLTHRFNGNLRRGSFSQNASNLFGLDQGAVVGFEYRFGIVPHVQAAVYRTAIDKTFQFYAKYDAIRQSASSPVAVSGLASIEGGDNFQERYAPALGLTVSRLVGDRVGLYATPIWVHNTAAVLDVDRATFFVGLGARVRVTPSVYVVGDVSPRAAGYSPEKPAFDFGIEKRYGGHVFQLNFGNGQGTTFAQMARGGFRDSLFMGFNLSRKFY